MQEFFGIYKKSDLQHLKKSKKKIWVHSLSVGEVRAITPVLKIIKESEPDVFIILSTTTEAGRHVAKKNLPFVDLLTYSPFDNYFCVKAAFNRIKPDMVVITETGFWPNLIHHIGKYGARSILIHGRISGRSFQRYMLVKKFVKMIFNDLDLICMQNKFGVSQLMELGVDKNKVNLFGDIKFDSLDEEDEEIKRDLRKRFSLAENILILIAGSTHEGEEEVLFDIFKDLNEEFKLLLILAPRRLERIKEIENLLISRSLLYDKASEIKSGERKNNIILLDTMGELSKIYSIGDIVFVGKSLFPPGGGHSLIEPAAFGKVVLHGTYMEYNRDIAIKLNKENIALEVKDKNDLYGKIKLFMEDKKLRDNIKLKAAKFVKNNQGASKKLADIIIKQLSL